MLLQRLATGATGVKQARYTQLPTDYSGLRGRSTYEKYVSSVNLSASTAIQHLHLRIPPRVLHFSAIR